MYTCDLLYNFDVLPFKSCASVIFWNFDVLPLNSKKITSYPTYSTLKNILLHLGTQALPIAELYIPKDAHETVSVLFLGLLKLVSAQGTGDTPRHIAPSLGHTAGTIR